MKKFWKERDGGIVEYIILLAIIGVVAAFIGFRLYDQGWVIEEIAGNHFGVALGENDLTPVNSPITIQPLGDPIITVLPGTGTYTTNTEFKFAATTFGGTPPYTYTWTNYTGGKSDGSMGDVKKYPEGVNEIKVKVTDQDGNEKITSRVLPVTKGLDVSIVAKKGDGTAYAPPYSTGIPVRFDAVPVNESGSYTCTWTGEYQGNSDCTGNLETYQDAQIVDITVKLCDTESCVTKQQSISIGEAPLQGVITAEPGTSISDETFTKLKVDISGGSGVYEIIWTNYTGGVDANGAFGNEVQYPSGNQVVKVRVCDLNMPELDCIEPTLTLNVSEAPPTYTPIRVSISSNPERSQFFTTEDVKFMAMASGGQGNKTISWSGYSGGSSTPGDWGSVVKFSAGTRTITATACDETGACASQSITITVADYQTMNITITSSPNRDIYDVEQVQFKFDVAGGTGNFDAVWSGYSGGSTAQGVFGTPSAYSVGSHTVSVTVCDAGIESYPCQTVDKTFNVMDFDPITVELAPEKEVVWEEWGMYTGMDSIGMYWNNKSTYEDPTYDQVFQGNVLNNNSGHTYIFDYTNTNYPYTFKNGETYEMEIYLRAAQTTSGTIGGFLSEYCVETSGSCTRAIATKPVTLTTSWQKVTFAVTANRDMPNGGYGFRLTGFPNGLEVRAAKPNIDAGYRRGSSIHTNEKMQFKVKAKGGSGNYTITWTNYSNGLNSNNVWGGEQFYTAGSKTVTATVCDATVPNGQACVVKSFSFDVLYPEIEAVITPNITRDVYDVEPIKFKYDIVSGGSGNYSVTWTNYSGGTSTEGTFGSGTMYTQGGKTISVTICDIGTIGSPCKTFSQTINVLAYTPIKAELVGTHETMWGNWGDRLDYYYSNYDYFTNTTVYRDPTYGDVFRGEVTHNTGPFAYLHAYKNGTDRRWNMVAGKEYTLEVYLKSNVTQTAGLRGYIRVECTSESCQDEAPGQNITLTPTWKKYTFKMTSSATGTGTIGFKLENIPLGLQVHAAKPAIDAGFEDSPIFDFQKVRFKNKYSGGSGNYNVFWTNYSGGTSANDTWGNDHVYGAGSKTVSVRICDALVTSQACVTKSVNFDVTAYQNVTAKVEAGVGGGVGLVYPDNAILATTNPIGFRVMGTGGGGDYDITSWSSNYSIGSIYDNTFGNAIYWNQGQHVITATACDFFFPYKPCATDSYTLTIQ